MNAAKETMRTKQRRHLLEGRTVLLADDDFMLRESIKMCLEMHGLNVITAVDGEDAVNKYQEFIDRIDVVVMDVVMPRLNGMDAYDMIRNINGDVKTLLISGYTEDIFTLKDVNEENLVFLKKPFRFETFISCVCDIICV